MLFNSYEFVFVFFPVALGIFLALRRQSVPVALGWLIVASLGFYAWWRPFNVLIIVPSLIFNFLMARLLTRLVVDEGRQRAANIALTIGVIFNLCFLGYFKYVHFAQTVMNDVVGTDFVITHVILPLGISFITFQKIAFLVDVHGQRVKEFTFRDFCLFVLFFPQLIAGPIVHFREMMPQFLGMSRKIDTEALATGATLFGMGLFKKVVLADSIALYVSPIYASAAAGDPISLLTAWTAALGFTLQIYFDFSAYSDMAAGLARCIGVRLPLNFDSPLKATSIIDFWARWHITLTRFLTAYVYNPLALALTRRRMQKKRPGMGGKKVNVGAFLSILAIPTIFTMFVSGLWHGAGYTFVLWGLLHGLYLVVNHAWRMFVARRVRDKAQYERIMTPVGFVLTFLAVVVGMVLFRADSMGSATNVLAGMVGLNGLVLPESLVNGLGVGHLVPSFASVGPISVQAMALVVALLAIAWVMPNVMEFTARYEPVIGFTRAVSGRLSPVLTWQPALHWCAVVSALVVVAIWRLGGKSEFLYWQF